MNTQDPIPQKQLEEIERFLLQEMPAEERDAFLARVASSETLKKNLDEMQLIFLGIEEKSLEERMGNFHNEITGKLKKPKIKPGKLYPVKMWIAAASVMVIVTISAWFIFFKPGKDEIIFTAYFQPDPGLVSTMSTSANYAFDRAMVDYKTGNYEAAIKAWDSLQHIQPGNDTLNYFLGVACLAKSETDKAIQYLLKVSPLPNSFFVKDANWYLGLAYLKQGKKTEAISFIEKSDDEQKAALLSRLR